MPGATLSVSSTVVNPFDTNADVAYTGEGFYNGDAIRGAGIYKTTNGGSSWYQLAAASPTASSDWLYVNRLSNNNNNNNNPIQPTPADTAGWPPTGASIAPPTAAAADQGSFNRSLDVRF